jgi:glutamate racemase
MDVVVLACTHFPLLAEELAVALPGVEQVDGAAGIARRIAYLTQGQPWPAEAVGHIALFTGEGPSLHMANALADFGLTDIRHV